MPVDSHELMSRRRFLIGAAAAATAVGTVAASRALPFPETKEEQSKVPGFLPQTGQHVQGETNPPPINPETFHAEPTPTPPVHNSPGLTDNELTRHRVQTAEAKKEAILDSKAAMERISQYFNNPQKFEAEHPDWVVKNVESGNNGLNLRRSPGTINDPHNPDVDNHDSTLPPHTPLNPLKGVAVKIGANDDGEWAIMYKDDPNGIKPVYFSVNNTEAIPAPPQK